MDKAIATLSDRDIREAVERGGETAFVDIFVRAVRDSIGGELNSVNISSLNSEQVTLLAWAAVHEEVMDGGFVQLIHNGYGGFIFLNPFAKAMRLWGLKDFSKLIYEGRKLYEKYHEELEKDCSDEEFMALFEQYPEFDDLDDEFVENEEQWTAMVAHYIDEHIDSFVNITE